MLQSAIAIFFLVAAVVSIVSILGSMVRACRAAVALAKQIQSYNSDLVSVFSCDPRGASTTAGRLTGHERSADQW